MRAFCLARKNNTERTKLFPKKIFVVDKLHCQGHVGIECAKYCDPHLYPIIMAINTVVVEQINAWAGPYKHSTKHMNWLRFGFFLIIVFNFYNEISLDGRFDLGSVYQFNLNLKKKARSENLTNVYNF